MRVSVQAHFLTVLCTLVQREEDLYTAMAKKRIQLLTLPAFFPSIDRKTKRKRERVARTRAARPSALSQPVVALHMCTAVGVAKQTGREEASSAHAIHSLPSKANLC